VKSTELRQLTEEQLELQLKETTKNLFHLRFQSATDRLETPSEVQKAKREVARIKTIQREHQLRRERAAAAPQATAGATQPAPAGGSK